MSEPTEKSLADLAFTPRLPEDILNIVLDTYTQDSFANPQKAVQVNSASYKRYQGKLYKHVKLDKDNVVDLQLHAILGLSGSNRVSKGGPINGRFMTFCQSIVYFTIQDGEAGERLARILDSSSLQGVQKLFRNVNYLTLKEEFMRSLDPRRRSDAMTIMESRDVMNVLGWAMKPKHLCIERITRNSIKCHLSPEVWRIAVMKKDWDVASISQHDIKELRMFYQGVPTQRFFLTDNPKRSRLRVVRRPDGPLTTMNIEILGGGSSAQHPVETDKLSEEIAKAVTVKAVKQADADACVCCGSK